MLVVVASGHAIAVVASSELVDGIGIDVLKFHAKSSVT